MTKKKVLITVILLLILAVIAAGIYIGICISLALKDNYSDKYTLKETDDTFLETVLKGTVSGDEYDISDTQINTYINKKYCGISDDSGAEHIMIYFHKDRPTEIYAQILYKGTELAIKADAEISIERDTSTVTVTLVNAYIGELKISDHFLSRILHRIYDNSEFVKVDRTSLSAVAAYEFEIKNFEVHAYLKIFTPVEGAIHCRSNSLKGEALRIAAEYIMSDEGREKISDIYNYFKDKVGSWFSDDE